MTDEEKLSRAWFAVEAHCIVSPSGTAPVYKDFRRDLIAKYGDLRTAAVRAATLAEVRGVVEGYANAYPVEVWPDAPFSDAQAASVMRLMVPRILDALAQPEGT